MKEKIMNDFDLWKTFNFSQSSIQLWVFKKSTTPAKFRAWYVKTDDEIKRLFQEAANKDVNAIAEQLSYTPLSQNNESSCLIHSLQESDGLESLINIVNQPELENIDVELQHLKGAAGYLVKFKYNDQTIYAVRKTALTWKPKVRNSLINAIFKNGELSASPTETFSFDEYFDFYNLNTTIFIKSKRAYESITSDKKKYQRAFSNLIIDQKFNEIFSDIEPLKKYIGTNAIQLRRMTVIQEKSLYSDPDFLVKVSQINSNRNFGLNFDDNGKIVICEKTVKTVMQILLDHRLLSELTDTIYDVPDAEAII